MILIKCLITFTVILRTQSKLEIGKLKLLKVIVPFFLTCGFLESSVGDTAATTCWLSYIILVYIWHLVEKVSDAAQDRLLL
jgi:hypothetical protein